MEAFAAGVPVVTYLPIPGHGRDNAATMAAAGVNLYAGDADQLLAALGTVTQPGGSATQPCGAPPCCSSATPQRTSSGSPRPRRSAAGATWCRSGCARCALVAAALLLCIVSYWAVALGGAEMSAHGIGVAKVPIASRTSTAYLGVLVDDSELDDPSSLLALGSRGASIVIDAYTVNADPAQLAARECERRVVNGGCGCRSRLRNRRAEEDLGADHLISARLGRKVTGFASARLDGFDYYYAIRVHERLVRPNRVLTMQERDARLAPGEIYLFDGRGVPAVTLVHAVDAPWRTRRGPASR